MGVMGEMGEMGMSYSDLFLIITEAFGPAFLHAFSDFGFRGRVRLRMPELLVARFVGKELEVDEMIRIIVGIFVAVAVAQLLHQLGRCVSQIEWDLQVSCFSHKSKGFIHSQISRVTFWRGGQINRGFCKRYAPLRHPDFRHGVEACVGK